MVEPDGQRDVEQQEERAHAEVDARPGEPRVEDRKRDAGRRESSSCRNVARTTVGHVAQDRVRRDLGAKDLEDGRERRKVLAQSYQRAHDTALGELLEEERQEGWEGQRDTRGGGNEPMKKTMKMEITERLIQS